jgi:hypothetical protein
LIGLLSIGKQYAGARDVNLKGRARSHELRVTSWPAWIAVWRLHRYEIALYSGNTALYHVGLGGGTLPMHLGLGVCLDLATLCTAECCQEHSGCQQPANFAAALAIDCVGSHDTVLSLSTGTHKRL